MNTQTATVQTTTAAEQAQINARTIAAKCDAAEDLWQATLLLEAQIAELDRTATKQTDEGYGALLLITKLDQLLGNLRNERDAAGAEYLAALGVDRGEYL